MTDPSMVITGNDWDEMTPRQQAKIIYNTVMSMREDVIGLSIKVDNVINRPVTPCHDLENRVCKLEKWKIGKMAVTVLSSFLGGIGGSHLPK